MDATSKMVLTCAGDDVYDTAMDVVNHVRNMDYFIRWHNNAEPLIIAVSQWHRGQLTAKQLHEAFETYKRRGR